MDELEWKQLVADHQTVLYGEWKNGVRTPGIVEYIADAKKAATDAKNTANGIQARSDRNRSLIIAGIATSILAPIIVGLALLYASAHVIR